MPGHDPFRAQTPTLGEAPAALTGDGAQALRIPAGPVAAVVAYIDNGASTNERRVRAAAVLATEQEKAKPRKGIVSHAEATLAG